MRKLIVLLFVILATLPVAAQAGEKRERRSSETVKNILGMVRAGLPRVSFPAIQNVAGINVRLGGSKLFEIVGNNMVVRNGVLADLTANVVVYGKPVVSLGPGDWTFDNRRSELHQPQIPVMVTLTDPAGQLVGMAAQSFQINGLYPTSWDWTISPGDIIASDGNGLDQRLLGTPRTELRSKKTKFPKKWGGGTAGVQIGNNSNYLTLLFVENGGKRLMIPPGGIAYIEDQLIPVYGNSLRRSLQGTWLDGDRIVGVLDESFIVPGDNYSIYAYQFICTPTGVRHYGY
jgi:hypothetical protein